MNSDRKMDDALARLPLLEPQLSVWPAMEERAGQVERRNRLRKRLQVAAYGLAATLAVAWVGYQVTTSPVDDSAQIQQTVDAAVRNNMPGARYTELRIEGERRKHLDALMVSDTRRRAPTARKLETEKGDAGGQRAAKEVLKEF